MGLRVSYLFCEERRGGRATFIGFCLLFLRLQICRCCNRNIAGYDNQQGQQLALHQLEAAEVHPTGPAALAGRLHRKRRSRRPMSDSKSRT